MVVVHFHFHIHHSSQVPSLALFLPAHNNPSLRLRPRQRLYTIHHILERLLILFRRPLRPLHLLSVIPLHFKSRQYQPRIQPIEILFWIRGKAFELLYEGEELIDVVAGNCLSGV